MLEKLGCHMLAIKIVPNKNKKLNYFWNILQDPAKNLRNIHTALIFKRGTLLQERDHR